MRRVLGTLAVGLALAAGPGCEGSGSSGGGLEVRAVPIVPFCTPAAGVFPSGLVLLSQTSGLATLAQFNPAGFVVYGLDAERPTPLAFAGIGADSDGDGVDDAAAMGAIGRFPLPPVMGEVSALRDDLALASTSNYEQVLVLDPAVPEARPVRVEVPASVPAGRYPLLPAPGEAAPRTGVSTLVCVGPDRATDSAGAPIAADCDPDVPSYFTNLTAGKAVAAGRLFVATSNLHPRGGSRFLPGTVLVYAWQEGAGGIGVRPDPDVPVLFTGDVGGPPGDDAGFNPTGVTRLETASGRELVLVTVTGAIGAASGTGNVLTASEIQVIDPAVPRIAARIPLGRAGPSFAELAVDPGARVAWLGASSRLALYAVDLRPLDDPALYAGDGPPIVLDGSSPPFPDARIFTADAPFALPDRAGGPPARDCEGFTHVAANAAGTDVYATDFCDGTFTRVRMDLSGSPPVPWPASRFRVVGQSTPFAPLDALGELRSPGLVAVRPGLPGVDYTSPDVLVIAGQPDAQLCALRAESFAPR